MFHQKKGTKSGCGLRLLMSKTKILYQMFVFTSRFKKYSDSVNIEWFYYERSWFWLTCICPFSLEEFEGTKGVITICKSKILCYLTFRSTNVPDEGYYRNLSICLLLITSYQIIMLLWSSRFNLNLAVMVVTIAVRQDFICILREVGNA